MSLFHSDKGEVRRSGRIYLRPLLRSDFSAYVDLERASEAWLEPWIPTPPSDRYSRRRFLEQVRRAKRESQTGTYFRFGIFRAVDDRLAGAITASGVHYGAMWSCYVGYWIGAEFAGQGLIPEALCLLFDYLFMEVALHRVQISIMPQNAPSRRVVEKLGLRDEGIALRYLKIAGDWRDHIRYAILSEEYLARKEELFQRFVASRPQAAEALR